MKYSDVEGAERLPEVVDHWESVTDLIIQREDLMSNLECFERSASDPNRFFQKGITGSSVSRISEEKTREKLMKSIKELEEEIVPCLSSIKNAFGDVVTYQGRPYCHKIQTDRVEMLYWLQQERREQALSANVATSEVMSQMSVKSLSMAPTVT